MKEVDLILWLVEPSTFIGAGERHIAEQLQGIKTPIILVINKTDTVKNQEDILTFINAYKDICNFAEIVPVSALRDKNTDRLLEQLFKYLPYGPQFYDEDTITDQPMLELIFAIFLPAIGSAILFNIGASSGGTDIIAMILKAHSSMNIGTALLVVDITSVVMSFFVFGPTTGLYSSLGLMAKSLVIDGVIENINLCKCFNIICDDPDPICDFIIKDLNRSATIYKAQGAFSHHSKTVIMTTMKRSQAVRLRNYIKKVEPTAFILISNSSEIIGKGFLSN